ncbi:MAG: hypothetical protein GY943_37350, partial [Chloroflexi bacterium]|nr:hypothetical protein [Chloroflexota bacterium]
VELSQLGGQADAIVSNNLRLTAVLLANGAIDQAQTFFRETRLLTTDLGEWYTLSVDGLQAQLDLVQGKRETAVRWLRTCGLHHDDTINASYTYIYLRFARILMALDQTADALTLLSRLITIAETSGANHTLIVSLVLQAMGLQAQNNIDAAIIALNRALTLAEPQGYVRTFINEGDAMGLLLRQTAVSVHAPSYVAKLLAALAQETSKIAGGSA